MCRVLLLLYALKTTCPRDVRVKERVRVRFRVRVRAFAECFSSCQGSVWEGAQNL